jgi:hypothetical protein
MGSAVKAVTKPLAKLPGVGGFIQGSILDPIRGKVETPTGYNPDASAYQYSPEQAAFQAQLKAQALGQDPTSQAQLQLQRGTDRNLSQIAGAARSARANQGLALREAFKAQAMANQDMAGQAATLRAQERAAAQDAYAQDLMRQQQSKQNLEGLRSGIAGATQQLQYNANLNKQQQTKDLFQQGANAALKTNFAQELLGKSDKMAKKDIKEISPKDLEEFATKLKASTFKYKKPNGEPYQKGEVAGIMAQDLEKSKIGKDMVVESDGGKMIDFKRAVPATMAAVSEVMKRIKKLEQSKS